MRALVVSDTHIPNAAERLPPQLEEEARRSNCCLLAGDLVEYDVYERLAKLTTVYGVCGNMDDKDVRAKLPEKQVVKLDGITVGLTHGRGAPDKIIEHINKMFAAEMDTIDIFVFGHSHIAYDKEIDGKIYFNPGSPTDTIFAKRRSYGILEINGKKMTRRIINLG